MLIGACDAMPCPIRVFREIIQALALRAPFNKPGYKDFDIILDRVSRITQPSTTHHAACGVLFLVAKRVEC